MRYEEAVKISIWVYLSIFRAAEFRTFNINDLKLNSDKKSKGVVGYKIN